jgi:erythromycin esterase-like protein
MEEELLEEGLNPKTEATDAESENLEYDDSDTYESDDDSTEEQAEPVVQKVEQKPINKTAEKFKKVLDKNKDLSTRLESVERELAIEKLSKAY